MTDEQFFELYQVLNGETTLNASYVHLDYVDFPDEMVPHLYAIAEKRFDPDLPQGYKELRVECSAHEDTLLRTLTIIDNSFRNGNVPTGREFCIDARFLNNDYVINFLNRWHDNDYINAIKIIGDDYTLDEETYNRLSAYETISVSNFEITRDNIFTMQDGISYTVGINSKFESEIDYIIKENVTDEELRNLIHVLNQTNASCKKIQIRFYNPVMAVEMIEKLDRFGLNSDIAIGILGYPLTEPSEVYNRLEEISSKRNIEVSYACCHDLLGEYCREPYLIDNSYFSELEPDGKTDLKTYVKILKFVENFQRSVDGIDSNVEKTMMAYQYLNENYYYDVDAGCSKNYGDTRDVDKIMDTDEIVCAGYANLLTIMCRRVGIPMFTFGAPGHRMNVARIVDKDEFGNVTLDKICTFDVTNDSGYYEQDTLTSQRRVDVKDSYTFFGLDPEEHLYTEDPSFITLANCLALPKEEMDRYSYVSRSPFGAGYVGGYSARSYLYSMLQLMGYNFDYNTTDIDDLIAQLQEEGRIGEIPEEIILETAERIEQRKGTSLTSEARDRITNSIDNRSQIFTSPTPKVQLNNLNNEVVDVNTYSMNMPNHEYVDIASIDIGPIYHRNISTLRTGNRPDTVGHTSDEITDTAVIEDVISEEMDPNIFTELDFGEGFIEGTEIRKPRGRRLYETDEEYVAFLERYYNHYFPQAEVEEENVFTEEDFSEGYIEGTNIRKPRYRGDYETDIEYVEFLRRYYEHYFPEETRQSYIREDDIFTEEDFSEGFIAGTTIRRPRYRGDYETDQEYIEFLRRYYEHYFPYAEVFSNTTYRLTRDQIIQDLPIYSREDQEENTRSR